VIGSRAKSFSKLQTDFLVVLILLGAASSKTGAVEFGQKLSPGTGEKTFHGMVTCSRCRAKHSPSLGRTATDCTLACVRLGSGFALIDGDNVYVLDGDPVLLKKVAGQRAEVFGALHGDTITVSSISTES